MPTTPQSAVRHGSVTVDTTADAGEVIVAARSGRGSLALKNIDATDTVYIGGTGGAGTGLTTSTGYPLEPGETITFSDFIGAIYGIVASGSAVVRYIEA